jgi:hypothetical protein
MFAFQVITSRDIKSLLIAAGMFLGVALVALYFRRQIQSFLTATEWRLFFKLLAIVVLALLLIFTSIAVEFPAEKFIYGRF